MNDNDEIPFDATIQRRDEQALKLAADLGGFPAYARLMKYRREARKQLRHMNMAIRVARATADERLRDLRLANERIARLEEESRTGWLRADKLERQAKQGNRVPLPGILACVIFAIIGAIVGWALTVKI